ncbi:MAG: LysM domain-containing protein [Planctomycetota bacterium]
MSVAMRAGRWTSRVALAASAAACLALVGCKADQNPTVETFPPPPPTFGFTGPADAPSADVPQGDAVFVPVEPASAAGAALPGQTYTVQKGDTLWSIASRLYGDGQKHRDILAANPQVNPSRLLVGQTLVLP